AMGVVDHAFRVHGPPIYVYHEIVHNKHVVDDFRRRGVTFVESIDDVPAGKIVVFSAHGVSPAVREQARARSLRQVDATCPLVTKVHNEVVRYARDGYHIVFIGHRDHQEAIGTVGEAPQSITVVEDEHEAASVELPADRKLAYVTQTTLSVTDAQRVIDALKRRFPQIKPPPRDDICYATTNRQEAVSVLSPEADLVLVVGSKNSSNSNRLVDRARECGKPAYLIDDESELRPEWFVEMKSVLVTAGASAPDHLIENLVGRLIRDHGGSVETRTLVDEDITFGLPKSARDLVVLGA
ncbi:MAG TPA: 4-hydroxy-3-methylbut-2-enyl diphosphate reductase, partial [Tepidisphaeraceae bacterium]|nr:4-hydroxy-3-methylbut-2-enyl diphosphate reductase [Tepidisphaeraceae bacterium]